MQKQNLNLLTFVNLFEIDKVNCVQAPSRIWIHNILFTREVLFQLSYWGILLSDIFHYWLRFLLTLWTPLADVNIELRALFLHIKPYF